MAGSVPSRWPAGSPSFCAGRARRSSWRCTTSGCRATPATSSRGSCAPPPLAACGCGCSTTSIPIARRRSSRRRAPGRSCCTSCRSKTAGCPGSPTSCTTSTWSATASRCGPARPTGRPTPGRARRTSSSRSTPRRSRPPTLTNFEELWDRRDVERSGRGDPDPVELGDGALGARRGSRPGTARQLSQRDREGDRLRAAAGADRLAGDHLGARYSRPWPSWASAAASTSPG